MISYGDNVPNECQHGPLSSERDKGWLKGATPPYNTLIKIVMDKHLHRKIPYYLNCMYPPIKIYMKIDKCWQCMNEMFYILWNLEKSTITKQIVRYTCICACYSQAFQSPTNYPKSNNNWIWNASSLSFIHYCIIWKANKIRMIFDFI